MEQKVLWSRTAKIHLNEAYQYIKKDSRANAKKVKNKILAKSASLNSHPQKYPVDRDKINNDGSYRSFIVYRYRISYRITESVIMILRMRHTSMEPLNY